MKSIVGFLFLSLSLFGLSGCVALVAGAGGGYVIGDETSEGDGNFDPLEKVRGKDDGKN